MSAIRKFWWVVQNGFGEWYIAKFESAPVYPTVFGPFDSLGEAQSELSKRKKLYEKRK